MAARQQLGRAPGAIGFFAQAPDPAATIVTIEIGATEGRHSLAAIAHPAGNRASLAVVILGDWQLQSLLITSASGAEAMRRLHRVPAVILAPARIGRMEVDLLIAVLADIGDK